MLHRLVTPLFCLCLGIAFVLAGCSETDPPDQGSQTAPPPSGADTAEESVDYPLKTCVVSDKELGSMGKPIDYKHDGKLVRFCCEGCIDQFKEKPDKYLAKIEQAKPDE